MDESPASSARYKLERYLRFRSKRCYLPDDAARIPIVLAAIALALLASGFSANVRDSRPVCSWRRA